MRKFVVAVAIVLLLLVGMIFILPFLLDLNRYRDQYLPFLEEALHRKVAVEDVRLTLFPKLGVQLKDVVIADDPAFSVEPFMAVPSVQVTVRWMPLLQRRVQVESVLIEKPSVRVIRSSNGQLNIATMGKIASTGKDLGVHDASGDSVSPMLGVFAVRQLALTGGTLEFEDRTPQPSRAYKIHGLTLNTESVAIGETAHIEVTGILLPYQKSFDVSGQLGPLQTNLDIPTIDIRGHVGKVGVTAHGQLIQGKLTVDVEIPKVSTDDVPMKFGLHSPIELSQLHAHVVASIFSKKSQARSQDVSIDPLRLNLQVGQSTIHLSGKGTPSQFSFVGDSPTLSSQDLPFPLPVQEPFELKQLQFEAEIHGSQLHLKSFRAKALDGILQAKGASSRMSLPLNFSTEGTYKNFSVGPLLQLMRPSSLSMTGMGELSWNMDGSISSNTQELHGPARLIIRNGDVIGFDLVQSIEDALKMSGVLGESTGTTKFSVIDASTAFGKDGIAVRELAAKAPNFALQSMGNIDLEQSVVLRGTVSVLSPVADKIIQRFPLAKVARKEGQLVLPFVVRGTVQEPKFRLDTQSLGNQVKKKVEERLEKVLQGDDQELQKLLDEGKDFLKQFFRK